MTPAQTARFDQESTRARQVLQAALDAHLAGRDEVAERAVRSIVDSPTEMFLLIGMGLGYLAQTMSGPVGAHECADEMCRVAQPVLDLMVAGDQEAAQQQLAASVRTSTSRRMRMDLAAFAIGGLAAAVRAGLVSPRIPGVVLGSGS